MATKPGCACRAAKLSKKCAADPKMQQASKYPHTSLLSGIYHEVSDVVGSITPNTTLNISPKSTQDESSCSVCAPDFPAIRMRINTPAPVQHPKAAVKYPQELMWMDEAWVLLSMCVVVSVAVLVAPDCLLCCDSSSFLLSPNKTAGWAMKHDPTTVKRAAATCSGCQRRSLGKKKGATMTVTTGLRDRSATASPNGKAERVKK